MRLLLGALILSLALLASAEHDEKSLSAVDDPTLESGGEGDNRNLTSSEEVSQKLDQENGNRLKKRNAVPEKSASEGVSKDMHIDHVQQGKDGMAYEINIDDGKSTHQPPKSQKPKRAVSETKAAQEGMKISHESKTDGGLAYSVDFNDDKKLKPKPDLSHHTAVKPKEKRNVLSDGIVREPSERLRTSMEPSSEIFHFAKPRFESVPYEDTNGGGFRNSDELWKNDRFGDSAEQFREFRPSTTTSTPKPLMRNFGELHEHSDHFRPIKTDRFSTHTMGEVPSFGERSGFDGLRKFDSNPGRMLNQIPGEDEPWTFPDTGRLVDLPPPKELSGDRFPPWKPNVDNEDKPLTVVSLNNSTDSKSESEETESSDEKSDENVAVIVITTSSELSDHSEHNPFRSHESNEMPPWHGKPWHRHNRWHHRRPPHHPPPPFMFNSASSSSSEEAKESAKRKNVVPLNQYETNYITNNINFDSDKKRFPLPEPFQQNPVFAPLMQMAAPPVEKDSDPTLRKQIADNRVEKASTESEVVLIVGEEQENIDPQALSFNLTVGPMTLVVIFLCLLLFFFIHLIRRVVVAPTHVCTAPVLPMKA